jgi:ferrous iron transport protein A
MTLADCKLNHPYIVKKLHTQGALRQRLISFGILKGVDVSCLAYTNLKSTYEIKVGKMTIALRKEEAGKIEVEEK